MSNRLLSALQHEFSDLADVDQWARLVVRLGMAVLLGGLIGYERESRQSPAGLRTHMLLALGTALIVLVPQQAGMDDESLSRVIQGVITGVGFLGAGAVVKNSSEGEVHGLTTAAGIWATAAIGVTVGLGRDATAIVATLIALLILRIMWLWERRLMRDPQRRRSADGDD